MTSEHSLVSSEEIEIFETQGVVCLRGILDGKTIQSLATAIDQVTEGLSKSAAGYDVTALRQQIFDAGETRPSYGSATQYDLAGLAKLLHSTNARPMVDEIPSGETGSFMLDTTTWRRNAAIRSIALDSALPEVASLLLSSWKINFCDDQVFVKEPHTRERTAFHQDYTYFHLSGVKGCVMWVCVDPADEESGAPIYVRQSHHWGREFRPNVFIAQTTFPGSAGEDLPDIDHHLEDYDVVQFATNPGDIIIHHFMTVHGAGGNRSNRQRRAISLRYCGDDMRYCTRAGAPDQPYHRHRLRDGDPLDSEQFPVVWPKPFPGFSLAPAYEGMFSHVS